MATDVVLPRSSTNARLPRVLVHPLRWTTAAWGAISVTALFIGITCWWLSVDRHVPIYDAGLHLLLAIHTQETLSSGHLGEALSLTIPYPPFAYLVGALGITVGGIGVAPPIIAQNLIFVPLLAVGCYQIGKRVFGPSAGLLAVIFALGSPLAITQFHVFMIDAPESAMVAVSIWLIIATERFSRVGMSAVAGLAVGVGMLTKEPFVFFVAGVLAVTFVRGGWREWRGLAVFAAIALIIALPWYIEEYGVVHAAGSTAVAAAGHGYSEDIAPARLSLDNLEWYFWNFINYQLFLPLFVFSVVGWIWMIIGFVRRRPVSDLAPEIAVGAFVAWLALTETFVHDTRYSEPFLVFLAIIGTGWIVKLPRVGRIAAATALVAVALANTLGNSFGAGKTVNVVLTGSNVATLQNRDQLLIYGSADFQVGAPEREGNLLGVMQALKRRGIKNILWQRGLDETRPHFSEAGVTVLAVIAGLNSEVTLPPQSAPPAVWNAFAYLRYGTIQPGEPPACVVLSDGTGVWVRIGNAIAPGARDYCPSHHPQFYGPPGPPRRRVALGTTAGGP